jgi:hypothetical protein
LVSIFPRNARDQRLQRQLRVQQLDSNAAFLNLDFEFVALLQARLLDYGLRNADRLTITPLDELRADGWYLDPPDSY